MTMYENENVAMHAEMNLEGQVHLLRLAFIESGIYPVGAEVTYQHPMPLFNRVFFFASGGCCIRTDDAEYELGAGDVYWLPCGLSFDVTYQAQSEFCYVHFGIFDGARVDLGRQVLRMVQLAHDQRLAVETLTHWRNGGSAQMRWRSTVLGLVLSALSEQAALWPCQSRMLSRVADVLTVVADELTAQLTVAAIADILGESRSGLSRRFRRHTGRTLKSYLTDTLMARAKAELADSDISAAAIARKLGYCDTDYFHRVFKTYSGLTPLAYRRASQAGRYPLSSAAPEKS